jgi:glycosyltransferase involved in cell wall biosynthesis
LKKAILASSLYYPNVGGVENSIHSMNECLVRDGWDVHIIVSDNEVSSSAHLNPMSISNGEKIFRYQYRSIFGPLAQIFRASRLAKKLDPDRDCNLVVARSHISVIALKLAGYNNVKYIAPGVVINQDRLLLKNKSTRRMLSFFVNTVIQWLAFWAADKVYVFSSDMLSQVRRFTWYGVNPMVVKPGVDVIRFETSTEYNKSKVLSELGYSDDNDIIILCVARYALVKGLDYVIKSLANLGNEFKLIIVGDGPEEDKYRELINELGFANRVKLAPKDLYPEKYYWASDIYVLPSLHESFGQVLLEATASGLPVVAFSRNAGVDTSSEEIYNGYSKLAFFSEKLDSKHLAKEIHKASLIKSSQESEFLSERKSFLSLYSWPEMLEFIQSGDAKK